MKDYKGPKDPAKWKRKVSRKGGRNKGAGRRKRGSAGKEPGDMEGKKGAFSRDSDMPDGERPA